VEISKNAREISFTSHKTRSKINKFTKSRISKPDRAAKAAKDFTIKAHNKQNL